MKKINIYEIIGKTGEFIRKLVTVVAGSLIAILIAKKGGII